MSTSTHTSDDSLITWFKTRIEAFHGISENPDLHTFFSDDARIVLNHRLISVDDFYGEFARRRFAVVEVTVDWQHIVDDKVLDAAEQENEDKAGELGTEIVAGSYIVTSSLKFRVRAAPAQKKSHVVFSARVKNQLAGDGWRISELYMAMVDKPVPITLPHVSTT
ncbi:hypothetical protein F5887DRAFT_1250022 [Amanita rubescens]|nr:hypothetical protein F5887DRAFT_1250022 [Amanita rubescens]